MSVKIPRILVISFGPIKSRSNGYFLRVWNIVKALNKVGGFKVIVVEFPEEKINQKIEIVDNITFIRLKGNEISNNKFSNIMKKFFTFDPVHMIKFQLTSFLEILKHRKLILFSDVIIIEGSLIFAGLLISKFFGKRVILDTHCINKVLARRFKNINKKVYILRSIFWDFLERFSIRFSDVVIVVSYEEARFVVKEYGVEFRKLLVVPNIVELPRYISQKDLKVIRANLGLDDKIIVVFIGDLRAVHNADAVNYIIKNLAPKVWRVRKDVMFLIVGRGDEIFKGYNLPNVRLIGYVKDIVPYIAMSDICIVPLRIGAGTKTKVLECLIYGKPVVTTHVGIEGLEDLAGKNNSLVITEIENFDQELLKTITEIENKRMMKTYNNSSKHLDKVYTNFFKSIKKVIKWIYAVSIESV